MRFSWKSGELKRNVRKLDGQTQAAIRAVTEFQSSRGEAYMKTNAPWTDRTGAARTTLTTITSYPTNKFIIVFAHGMHYGIWLEVANSGDYQIIMPSVRVIGKDTIGQLDNLFRRLK